MKKSYIVVLLIVNLVLVAIATLGTLQKAAKLELTEKELQDTRDLLGSTRNELRIAYDNGSELIREKDDLKQQVRRLKEELQEANRLVKPDEESPIAEDVGLQLPPEVPEEPYATWGEALVEPPDGWAAIFEDLLLTQAKLRIAVILIIWLEADKPDLSQTMEWIIH